MLAVETSTTDTKSDIYNRILQQLALARKSYVTIGLHEGAGSYENGEDVISVGIDNEFGVNVPERSFMRSAIDEHLQQIDEWREEGLTNIIDKGWTTEKALQSLGFKVQVLIQNKIQSDIPPPNAPSTTERKIKEGKAPRTLLDTRLMLRSVTFKVVIQ